MERLWRRRRRRRRWPGHSSSAKSSHFFSSSSVSSLPHAPFLPFPHLHLHRPPEFLGREGVSITSCGFIFCLILMSLVLVLILDLILDLIIDLLLYLILPLLILIFLGREGVSTLSCGVIFSLILMREGSSPPILPGTPLSHQNPGVREVFAASTKADIIRDD